METRPHRPTQMEAILVMDSRSTQIAIRNQNFGGAWSRLYKAGAYYLDLALKPEDKGAVLIGQILSDKLGHPKGLVTLRSGLELMASTSISPTGSFRLALAQPGEQVLEVVLQDQVIQVGKLEV